MFSEVVGIVADLGLGAIAIGLIRALRADVEAIKALVARLDVIITNHEKRLEKLEEK